MKDDNMKELMVNHNYFIRIVITEILGLIALSIVLSIIITLVVIFVKDPIWIVLASIVAYLVMLFIKVGKIRSTHSLITSIEDKAVKNSVHNISKEYWKP